MGPQEVMQDCGSYRTPQDGECCIISYTDIIWCIIFFCIRRPQLQMRWVTVTVCTWLKWETLRWWSLNMVNHCFLQSFAFLSYLVCSHKKLRPNIFWIVSNRERGWRHLNCGDQGLHWQPDGWHWEGCGWWSQHLQGFGQGMKCIFCISHMLLQE